MLNFLNTPESALESLVLSKAPQLYTKRRGKRLLVLLPQRGTWIILDELFQSFFKKLSKPIRYKDFISNSEGIPSALFIAFIEETYRKGMLLLSGKQIEYKSPEESNSQSMQIINYIFSKNDSSSIDYLRKILKDKLTKENRHAFHLRLTGSIFPDDPQIMKLITETFDLARECNKGIGFAVDISPEALKREIPQEFSKLPVTFYYSAFDTEGEDKKDNLSQNFIQVLNKASLTTEKKITSAFINICSNPSLLPKSFEKVIKSEIVNTAVKINPNVFLSKSSITGSIRTMEEFAMKYIEILDIIKPIAATGNMNLVLHDIHRFLSRTTSGIYPFLCGKNPCDLGDRIQIFTDTGEIYACRPFSHKTAEALRLSLEDAACPSCSANLSFWKQDRLTLSPRCQRCVWRNFCKGGCPSLTYERYDDISREDPRCRFFQIVFEDLLWKVYDTPILLRNLGGFG